MALHEKIFTASGSWTCPAGIKRVEIEGCGGGGGGGGGYYTTNSTNLWLSGGSGGGGAKLGRAFVSVTPNAGYTITVGSGGAGGAASLTGLVKATDGGDTSFEVTAGATKVLFSGGGAGYAGGGVTGAQLFRYHLGGQSVRYPAPERNDYSVLWIINTGDITNYIVRPDIHPHEGGFSVGTNDTSMGHSGYGGPSDMVFGASAAFRGGQYGDNGTDSGTYRGGSGGGGGGAGAYGPGAAGGDGGNANGSGQGAFGQPGSDAAANTGAGGGGGGAPGCGSSNVGVPGAGGDGGSGYLVIRWWT